MQVPLTNVPIAGLHVFAPTRGPSPRPVRTVPAWCNPGSPDNPDNPGRLVLPQPVPPGEEGPMAGEGAGGLGGLVTLDACDRDSEREAALQQRANCAAPRQDKACPSLPPRPWR